MAELAGRLDCSVVGEGTTRISGVCALSPGQPGHIGFLANPTYRRLLGHTEAAAVVLTEADAPSSPVPALVASNPHLVFARLAELFASPRCARPGSRPGSRRT
ncbi:MAG: LpxD N-terminal domain-containing protein, partial [Candidatus Macondimonas sp.]